MLMKNLFGINDEIGVIDGAQLITKQVPKELMDRQEEISARLQQFEKKTQTPLWNWITRIICIMVAVVFTTSSIVIGVDKGFSFLAKGFGWMVVLAVCSFLIFLALIFIERIRKREELDESELQAELMKAQALVNECRQNLGIPDGSSEITVFANVYRKKGEKTLSVLPLADYVSIEMFLFTQGDKICLADSASIISIGKEQFCTVERLTKRINFHGWTKREHFSSPTYAPYVKLDSRGFLSVKECVSVVVSGESENFEIIVPPYDAPVLLQLIERKTVNQ